MKRTIKNGISILIILISLFAAIPSGVMAEDMATEDENVLLETSTATQAQNELQQSDVTQITDSEADQADQVNTSDVSIEVTLSETGSLKSDVSKKMISMGISKYEQITSLKINAGPGVKVTTDFIYYTLVNLRKIDLSNVTETSVTSFQRCENLEEVIFQDGAILSEQMFRDCTSLKSIDLSNVDPNFESGIFMGCSSLEEVVLPYGAKTSYKMFTDCTSLKSIDLSNANPKIGFSAFESCTSLEKVILPPNTILLGFTFNSCKLLDDINWDAIKGFSNDFSWHFSDFKGCAFEFTKGYPFSFWNDSNNSSNGNQIPKLYFSLEKNSYQLNVGDSFTLPKPIFKTKSGTNYSDLEKYKNLYDSWLDQDTSYLNKMTYKTMIKHEGQDVNSIDTSIPGNYEITYNLLSTTNADCHTLTCNVTVIPGYSISKFTTDKPSGQVTNSVINLTAAATAGETPYQYKFYYRLNNSTVVLKDFSSVNTATFKPTTAGTYSLFVDAKDNSGKTCTKNISDYVIKNDVPDNISCLYRTHVQNVGWQDWKTDGTMSGTSSQGLRLEGIEVKLDNQGYDLGVEYSTHIQNIGWQEFKYNGVMSGTSGQGLRLEAIKINLTGNDADQFDIYYRVHAQNVGWLDWASNGAESGTAGLSYRLEGIEIKVTPKGDPAPGATANPFIKSKLLMIQDELEGTWSSIDTSITYIFSGSNYTETSDNGTVSSVRSGLFTLKERSDGKILINFDCYNTPIYSDITDAESVSDGVITIANFKFFRSK